MSPFLFQDIKNKICDPMGRNCIETNSAETFNCSTSCTGIYADVQWVGSDIEEELKDDTDELGDWKGKVGDDMRFALIEREMKLMRKDFGEIVKSTFGKGVEEQDRKKYRRLISEYRKFKTRSVKHFRFNNGSDFSAYGRLQFINDKNLNNSR